MSKKQPLADGPNNVDDLGYPEVKPFGRYSEKKNKKVRK